MNKTVKYALCAVMTLAFVAPVFAQDNFPDVQENHWAYSALQRMKKEGILVGYPDGLFRGTRPATRYEMAVAINAAYQNLRGITDGLDSQISAINSKLNGMDTSGLDDMRNQIKSLQDQVDSMKTYGQDIDDLKKMVGDFEKELTAMGADVADMKNQLASLDKRVTALESHQLPVDVHGDLNIVTLAGYSTNSGYGVTYDGRPTGFGRGSYVGAYVGANRDLTVLHEASIELDSNNQTGPQFHVVGASGNMIGTHNGTGGELTGFADQAHVVPGSPYNEGQNDFYFQQFDVVFAAKAVGLGFSADLGRIGYKISPYIFQRPDNTPYFSNSRWDNGKWAIDGGMVSFAVGTGSLNVFAGRISDIVDSNNTPIQGMTAGPDNYNQLNPRTLGNFVGMHNGLVGIDQLLGANVTIPLGPVGSIDLAYLFLDSNTITANANRVSDYGGTIDLASHGLKFNGGYTKTDVMYNDSSVNRDNDSEYNANLAYDRDKYGINVGYRYIEPFFAAPGDWGRIGVWYNPTDIKGFTVGGHINLEKKLMLSADGEFYTGTGKIANGLGTNDKISRETADLKYNFNDNYDVDLGFENDEFNLAGLTGSPDIQWYNIGFGYNFSSNAMVNVLWQISNYDSKNQPDFSVFGGQTKARGGLITTQLTIKF